MKKKKVSQAAKPVTGDKSAAPVPAKPPAEEIHQVPHALAVNRFSKWDIITLALFFAAVVTSVFITVGRVSIALMLLCLIFSIRKSSFVHVSEHLSLPVIGLFAMVLVYGIAAIYSPFGETAVLELFRGMCAFSIAGFAILRFEKKHVPVLLWIVVGTAAALSFVSVDMTASQLLYKVVLAVCDLAGQEMGFDPMNGPRLNGIFNNANVLASIAALGLLLGLYQLQTLEKKWQRVAAALLLGINATVFWVCTSRGAILCFGISLLAYLFLTKKGQRLRLFMLMPVCVVVTVPLASVAARFMSNQGGSFIPDLLALACGPVILLLDSLISERLSAVLMKHQKILLISGGVLAAACVIGAVCALTLTEPYTFYGDDANLHRTVNLTPGQTYTVSGDWDGDPTLTVSVEGKDDLLMDWATPIYEGPLAGAEFYLPDDTAVIHLVFQGKNGETLQNVVLSDGTKVKLDYKLLPASIENILQDNLFTSMSFLLRVQYMKDALKIWATSPLIGRGLTSTDNLYTAVQPVYYQSKFVHNHILQYMADTGLIGLGCFLLIVVGLAWLLLKKWNKGEDPLAAVFLACLAMMNLHSLMEINFSIRAYAVTAYLLLAVMTLAYGEPILLKGKDAVKHGAKVAAVGFLTVLAAFSAIILSYQYVAVKSSSYETPDHDEFMGRMETFIKLDMLDDDYYKILYVAQGKGVPKYAEKVRKYAMELRESGTFTNCDAVARYYYLPNGMLDEIFVCSREGIAQKAADAVAWNAELDFYRAKVLPAFELDWEHAKEPFIQGILDFCDYLVTFNEGRMEQIELSEDNQAFVDTVLQIWKDPDISLEDSYALLSQYTEAESEK